MFLLQGKNSFNRPPVDSLLGLKDTKQLSYHIMDVLTIQTHEPVPLESILVSVLVLFLSGSLRSAAT